MQTATELRQFRLHFPRAGTLELVAGRPRIVGIVNITPDSFSDGGRYLAPERAVEHALRLVAEGAEVLDLGAESTRPGGGVYGEGARATSAAEELDRLLPVLTRVRERVAVPISIDTRKAEVARAALAAGADLVNDVSALGDPEMAGVVIAADCPIVLMHSRGELATMQARISFADVVSEVRAELLALLKRAVAAGIRGEQVVLDPGLGFGKSAAQNLALLRATAQFCDLGWPLLVGASRKSFLGSLTGSPVDDRQPESLAAAATAAKGGAALLRVHDVAATRNFLAACYALEVEGAPA